MQLNWDSYRQLYPRRKPAISDELEVDGRTFYVYAITPEGVIFSDSPGLEGVDAVEPEEDEEEEE